MTEREFEYYMTSDRTRKRVDFWGYVLNWWNGLTARQINIYLKNATPEEIKEYKDHSARVSAALDRWLPNKCSCMGKISSE